MIELYRQQGNLEDLRQVRERVHQLYCLPVDMWLDWLSDEQNLMNEDTPEQVKSVLDLYEKAIADYKYYKVCRNYCKLVLHLYYGGKIES